MKHFDKPLLELKNIQRLFSKTAVIDGVSFSVHREEVLGIIGRSGAGKSTLIRCINGLECIDSGQIFFETQNIAQLNDNDRRLIRRRIGMIFQNFNLLSSRRIIDNVALPLKLSGASKANRRRRALDLLDIVSLADKAAHYPVQLSGGQKQRVCIARALATNPSVLLSDEATSALDPETTQSILELLTKIKSHMGLTIILITHEMEIIRSIATRLIVLDQGRILEEGSVRDVFAQPKNETTKSLLQVILPTLPSTIAAKLNFIDGQDAIIEFHISGLEAHEPFLNKLEAETGMVARIIQGGIEYIQNEAIGRFFLAIKATDKQKLEKAYAWLAQHSDKSEIVGYV
ncbi:MAG: D-methionine transport system ATP-binding protein [Candidatus Tokpelaia sp. JSC085]|nr:MAG: D-methionine transport system ATP-binding protein [Candidatus Tokpelaia sp. JSC085]